MLLECNVPTASSLVTRIATERLLPSVSHNQMPRQIPMKARLIIGYLIDGLDFPIWARIGVVTVVICCHWERQIAENAVVCKVSLDRGLY
jgi:hypothetical protein